MNYTLLSKYRSELMGVAMLWVMFFHAWDLDMGHPLLEWVRAAGFGGVDIFILLSAMGLVMSLGKREQEYAGFMVRRAKRIFPAYLLVMVPYTLLLILFQNVPWSTLLFNVTTLYYWVRCPGAFNWYVAGIMIFYAITPFCFRRWDRSRAPVLLTAGWVAVTFGLCQLLLYDGYWHYMDIFYRFPVFGLGLLMGFFVRDGRRIGAKDLGFWGLWLGLGCGYLWISRNMSWGAWPVKFPLCLLFLFTTVPMCLVLGLLFDKLPLGWVRKGLRLVGENSLEIYLFNVSIFSHVELWRRVISFGPTNRLYWLIIFAVNIALGVALHRGIEKLKK